MAKDPAFLFYPNDWVGGTMGMTFEEKGAYMEILMLQFNRGHMTEHMIGQTVGQLFGQIKDKFIQDADGLWYNERLDIEKEKRKNYTQSRFNNKKGINQYKENTGHTTTHMSSHMVNVNEDVNINKEKDKKEVIPTKEEFINYCKSIYNNSDKNFEDYKFSIELKYDSWILNGWKDGKDSKIKNWKSKINNTIPYLTTNNKPIVKKAIQPYF
jgi:uncharacterized protein YdaU (DUF1376 family)